VPLGEGAVPGPGYDRTQVVPGVVHFGVGGFHRAHQAMYHDRLLNAGKGFEYGICGVGVMPQDRAMKDALEAQDHLYTLVVKHADGTYEPRVIGSVIDAELPANATITSNGMTGEITQTRQSAPVSYHLDDDGRAVLPPCAIVRSDTVHGALGFDLLQWGDIDDVTADNSTTGATQWSLTGNVASDVDGSGQFLRLSPSTARGTTARPIARSGTPLHRWFDAKFEPLDGEPTYSLHLRTRGTGVSGATMKVAAYDVDDTDPQAVVLHPRRQADAVGGVLRPPDLDLLDV